MPGMHIIHLEDSAADAELIRDLLEEQWPGCQVTTITSGAAFEAAVTRGGFDLILSDYTLPGYDGLAALAFARANAPDLPFIYISGTIGEERAIEALKAGATDYVIKDRPARLIPAIRGAILQVQQEQERRRAEQKIREQASLLEKANQAICVITKGGEITFWNACAERLYGWSAAEATGQSLRSLIYPNDTVRFDAAQALLMEKGEWRGQLGAVSRTGDALAVESSWSLVDDVEGEAKVLCIDSDITAKQRFEAQIMTAQRLETIGLLTGGIAHDLNNVLAPILTSVDLLRQRATHAEDRETLEALEKSAEHGAELVRQLLSFARGTSGKRSEVAVDVLIDSVRRLLQRAMPAMITIRAALDRGLWRLNADVTQLRQVLLNLCLNARDAMARGGVIEVRAENVLIEPGNVRAAQGDVRSGPHVKLSVADCGIGIPAEIVSKIFDPFFTTKQAGKGTGLGLANVASIVKAHDGFVTVESTLGVGTTFHLHFPALVGPVSGAQPEIPVPQPVGQGRGERILIVEDDEAIRTVLEVILHTRGYEVTIVSDGGPAIDLLERRAIPIDLVMTDLNMPEVTGFDVIRQVRSMENPPQILAMSGLPPEQQDDPSLEGVELMRKPLTAEALLRTVRRVLDAAKT